jgi:hypothetical protein
VKRGVNNQLISNFELTLWRRKEIIRRLLKLQSRGSLDLQARLPRRRRRVLAREAALARVLRKERLEDHHQSPAANLKAAVKDQLQARRQELKRSLSGPSLGDSLLPKRRVRNKFNKLFYSQEWQERKEGS